MSTNYNLNVWEQSFSPWKFNTSVDKQPISFESFANNFEFRGHLPMYIQAPCISVTAIYCSIVKQSELHRYPQITLNYCLAIVQIISTN